MISTSLIMRDELINPFDQTTEDLLYVLAERIPKDEKQSTQSEGLSVKIEITLSNEMII